MTTTTTTKTAWYYCKDENGCLYMIIHASNDEDAWEAFKKIQSKTNKKLTACKTYEEPWWVQGGLD